MKRVITLLLCTVLLICCGAPAGADMTDIQRAVYDISAELDDDPQTNWETPFGASDLRRVAENADDLAEMLEKLAEYAEAREYSRFKTAEEQAAADALFEKQLKEMKDEYKDLLEDDLDDIAVPYVDIDGKTTYIEIEEQYGMLFDINNYKPSSSDKRGVAGEGGNSTFLMFLAEQVRALKLIAERKAGEARLDSTYWLSEKTQMDKNALDIGIAGLRAYFGRIVAEEAAGKAKELALSARTTAETLIQDSVQIAYNSALTSIANAQTALYAGTVSAYEAAVTSAWSAVTGFMAGLS